MTVSLSKVDPVTDSDAIVETPVAFKLVTCTLEIVPIPLTFKLVVSISAADIFCIFIN